MVRSPRFKWIVGVVVVAVLLGLGVHAAIGAVQEPYLVQAKIQGSDGWRYALVVVQRTPTSADIQKVVQEFAAKVPDKQVTAEFYTDGNAAVAFEAGGAPFDSDQGAQANVAEFKRPQSGSGSGWVNAKGAKDSGKITVSAP